jgi:branched-chain amino acid transport system permease protein
VTALTYAFVGGEWALAGRAIVGLTLVLAILFLPQGAMGVVARWRRRRALAAPRPPVVAPAPAPSVARHPAAAPGAALLECRDVHLAFRGVKALAGVDLEVREGEILGLVGPNGSGKSTLINVISGYYKPDAGRLGFAGRDLAQEPGHRIARLGVARTYQIPRPFKRLSVLDNVVAPAMFGAAALDRAAAEGAAWQWLDFVGLGERARALPTELNLHQRKFLELARALAARPRLILLDEVLAGLTPTEIENALTLVRRIRDQGATIVFVEHNMRAVTALADRMVVLNYGQVIAEGAPRQVMQATEVVEAYLGAAHG